MGRLFTKASSHRIYMGTAASLRGLDYRYGTVAMCLQFAALTGSQTFFCTNDANPPYFDLVTDNATLTYYDGTNASTGLTLVANQPLIVAASKATGTVTPRLHWYRFDTNVWVHANGSLAVADAGANTALTIGSYTNSAGAEAMGAEVHAVGMWPGVVMDDKEIEHLTFGDWGRLNPGFWDVWDTSHDNIDMFNTLGRYPAFQTARTGAARGIIKPPPGFKASPVRHRR